MENMETNDIITTEAIEEITESNPTGKNCLKTAAEIGIIGAASIAVWEFGVKRIIRWGKRKIAAKKAASKNSKKPAEADDDKDIDNMTLDDIPEIDEE